MRTKKMLIAGLAVLAVSFTSNLQWSMQDYGLKSISLSEQLLAQGTTETGWWDKTTGAVSDWWHDLHNYSKDKKYLGVTRQKTTTNGSSGGGTVTIGNGNIGASGSSGSNSSVTIVENEYLYECQDGKDDFTCTDSWKNSPNK